MRGTLTLPSKTGYIPEDRVHDALILDFALHENVALREAVSLRGRVGWQQYRNMTVRLTQEFDIRTTGTGSAAGTLSGGNQQKLILARELQGAPDLLVAENPTRGLDIAATAAVHARLRATRDGGAAVILHSTDLDEVLAIADRVVVVYAGTVRQVDGDRDAVGRAMLGLS
jgi:general nucleoside transport system ATP-binding protein